MITIAQRRLILKDLILNAGSTLKQRVTWADPVNLLAAIAEKESAFGQRCRFRHERSYDENGGYWKNKSCGQPWRWDIHGSLACGSFGSFQILFPTAVELGLDPLTHPCELNDDTKGIHWVLEFVNRRILDEGVCDIKAFAVTYNGGNPKAINTDTVAYATEFEQIYNTVMSLRMGMP